MKRLATLFATLATCLAGNAGAANTVSTNWSGYSVTGQTFSSVSGGWTQPKASCTAGAKTSSAFWVGLGGNSEGSNALEQIGSSTECRPTGTASYSAWYELVPAASITIPMVVNAGDKMWATVNVSGTSVTVEIDNHTTGKTFKKVLTMADPDVSSAEWIAEAPSVCYSQGSCSPVALTNFGQVAFRNALATAGGHSGTISDSLWSAVSIELQSSGDSGPFAAETLAAQAVPSALSYDGRRFTVKYGALTRQVQPDPYARGGYYPGTF